MPPLSSSRAGGALRDDPLGHAAALLQALCKSFTPVPKDRRVTPEKAEQMASRRRERLSPRAVARALKVSRDTMRRTLTKRPHPSG
jgi:hypothetical protein